MATELEDPAERAAGIGAGRSLYRHTKSPVTWDSGGRLEMPVIDTKDASELTGCLLTEADFRGMQYEWQTLLDRSAADPLFMSWEWLSAWWETWSRPLGLELFLVAAYQGTRLIGLAPCFRYQRQLCRGIGLSELHFIGNAWYIASTVATEYVDLIVDNAWRDEAVATLSRVMRSHYWNLIVLDGHASSATTTTVFARLQDRLRLKTVPRTTGVGIRIDTTGAFDRWLAGLGQNTRLKAYNRRRYLRERGMSPELAIEPGADKALALLNAFHEQRHGKPCFEAASLDFHLRFLSRLQAHQQVQFSVLRIAGEPRSILYDLQLGARVYNLQAGFDEHFDRKVSLGTLHLGYAVEAAFLDPAVGAYDLLAGTGKKTFYKEHFNGEQVFFQNGHYLRSPWLKAIAVAYQAIPQRLSWPLLRRLEPRPVAALTDSGGE